MSKPPTTGNGTPLYIVRANVITNNPRRYHTRGERLHLTPADAAKLGNLIAPHPSQPQPQKLAN